MTAPLLLLAQTDDATGEMLGRVLEQLADLGAKNVQLLSGIGKKGRPAYSLLIDVTPDLEWEVADLLAGELGIWGYRVLQSEHKHFEIQRHVLELELVMDGSIHRFPLRVKRILHEGRFIRAKAEHEDLVGICTVLARSGHGVYQAVLKARVEAAFELQPSTERLVLSLEAPGRG